MFRPAQFSKDRQEREKLNELLVIRLHGGLPSAVATRFMPDASIIGNLCIGIEEFTPPYSCPVSKTIASGSTETWDGHAKGSRGYSRVLAALALAGVATFAQLYSTQAVLPLMASDLQITAAEAALSISLATVGLAVTVLPWSFVADRIGRVRAMAIGIAVATLLGLLVPLAPTVPVLLGLRTLEGMALGGIPAIAIAYLNEEVTKVHTALAAGTYVAGTTLGGLAGRLVAGPVGELWGWRAAALAVSLLATVSAVLFLVLVPKQRRFSPAPAMGFRGRAHDVGRALEQSQAACRCTCRPSCSWAAS